MDRLQLTPPKFTDEQLASIAGALVISGTERSVLVRLLQLVRVLEQEEIERCAGLKQAYLSSWLMRFVCKIDEEVSIALFRMLQREGLLDDDDTVDLDRVFKG